jgi:hypothetical protein
MKMLIHGAALATLVGSPAFAQSYDPHIGTGNIDRTDGLAQHFEPRTLPWSAPVGHRQPRAADIPAGLMNKESDAEQERLDRDLARKLQICRGC